MLHLQSNRQLQERADCVFIHISAQNWYKSAEYGPEAYRRAARAGKVRRKEWTPWQISKSLTLFGRHAAKAEGVDAGADGFMRLEELARNWHFRDLCEGDAERVEAFVKVIEADKEGRYELKKTPSKQALMFGIVREMGGLKYRCTSGHSMDCIRTELMGWERLTSETCPEYLLHGTNETGLNGIIGTKFLRSSKSQSYFAGVKGATSRKERLHQHFLGCGDLTGPVPHKLRKKDLLLYLNAHEVLRSGAQIYKAKNGTILIECDIPTYVITAVRQSSNWGWRLEPGNDLSTLSPTARCPPGGVPAFRQRYEPRPTQAPQDRYPEEPESSEDDPVGQE